jgi:transcriptional regulator with XRE-family HTH domain
LENFEKKSSPSVGQRIKAARKAKGLTLTQLGELIGITNQALSAIERGKARPSRQTLKSLSRVLNENLDGRPTIKLREPRYASPESGFVPRLPDYEEEMYRRAEEAFEASRMPKPVRRAMVEVVYVPIHYEILNGDTLNPYDGLDRVLAPAHMVPVLKHARAARVVGASSHEVLAEHGDIIILTECSDPLDGKVVLVETNGKVFLRRLVTSGRKVKLDTLDQKHEPVELPSKNIKCVGEVTGMLKSTRSSTLPIPVCGIWPVEWAR